MKRGPCERAEAEAVEDLVAEEEAVRGLTEPAAEEDGANVTSPYQPDHLR